MQKDEDKALTDKEVRGTGKHSGDKLNVRINDLQTELGRNITFCRVASPRMFKKLPKSPVPPISVER